MANPDYLQILKQGVEAWNRWRVEHPDVRPILNGVRLGYANLSGANLSDVNFMDANLEKAYLDNTDLSRAYLRAVNLSFAVINNADLSNSVLMADLRFADLRGANLDSALINGTNFHGAVLGGADFTNANLGYSTFTSNDLGEVKGLEAVKHSAPSIISVDTLYRSAGKIPEAFLRGCGVPDDFITFIPSHFGIQQAIQFYSCFISYSTRDEEFARRLYSRMRDEKLRVWFAPEEMKGGQKLQEQIERAIQLHDRLLLVLSESSMQSEWVINEIQRARETEIREGRRKLFPITIVEFEKVKAWRRFDADTGKDLAKEVREYFIPDFSNWKDHDAFEKAFARLLHDLRAEEARP